jgi:hypothetical protein
LTNGYAIRINYAIDYKSTRARSKQKLEARAGAKNDPWKYWANIHKHAQNKTQIPRTASGVKWQLNSTTHVVDMLANEREGSQELNIKFM